MGITHALPISPDSKVLSQCIAHTGTIIEISKLLKTFNRDNRNFFMSFESFTRFCKKTKLAQQSEGIFKLFSKGLPERISIYELLAGIILFSTLTWKQKINLGFSLFDFDNDSNLNKDELQMLLVTYSNTIATTTKFKIQIPDIFNALERHDNELVHVNQ